MVQAHDVLQLASLGEAFDTELAARYRVKRWTEAGPLACRDDVMHCAVVVTSVRRGFQSAWFEALPALRAICSWGVGYDTLDVSAAAQRGIKVSNTPDVLNDCVADMAWALLLSTARRTAAGDRYVKNGSWKALGEFPLSTRVSGKHLGLLGMGRIGQAIAKRATGFDMPVRYHARHMRSDLPYEYAPTLIDLAKWADFLVLACPGGPATRHVVDRAVIEALGPGGILVNIARGSVVDQAALLAALRNGSLGGAGLDVLEVEPSAAQDFADMDQVTLTPHMASATWETRAGMSALVMDNVAEFFRTGSLLTPVTEIS